MSEQYRKHERNGESRNNDKKKASKGDRGRGKEKGRAEEKKKQTNGYSGL
jgi:hypothetical protein